MPLHTSHLTNDVLLADSSGSYDPDGIAPAITDAAGFNINPPSVSPQQKYAAYTTSGLPINQIGRAHV